MGIMGISGGGSVPVLQGVAKPTALLWELLVSAEILAVRFDGCFKIMNSPDALEIEQTGAHASNLIPDVRGCFFLNDHGFHKGGMPKVAKINGGS